MPSKPTTTARPTLAQHRRRLELLRAETLERQASALAEYDALAEAGDDVGAGDDEGGSEGDGTFVERDRLRASADADRDRLDEIDAALARAATRTWRQCSSCGGDIGADRLEAMPKTSVCVTCKAGTAW